MKTIRVLSEVIEDALEFAEERIDEAMDIKADSPEAARVLGDFAESVMDWVTNVHTVVAKIISDYRKTNGEPPEAMMYVYNYLHKKHIDHAAKVRAMYQMYRDD